MKHFPLMILFFAIPISFIVISLGCASKEKKGSSVTDNSAVLQKIGQDVCLDVNSEKMWQIEREGIFSSYEEAEQYAVHLRLGGYDDWRLPTKSELFDLHYIFYWKKNGNCTLKSSGEYWTFDDGKPSLGHWETHFLCEPNYKYVKSLGTKGYVRAVRK
jgi:hypothetical protein